MDNEVVIESTLMFSGRIINVRLDTVRLADGTISTRDVVAHPGAVCILPVLNGNVLMVRQYRLPAEKPLLELPAGTRHPHELPEVCAARELEEETGYRAGSLQLLGSFYVAPGYSSELIYAYIATDLSPCVAEADFDERLELERYTIAESCRMAAMGEIQDAKTISALLMAAARNSWKFEL
jgi:ADP-ribose pyrophosphatase